MKEDNTYRLGLLFVSFLGGRWGGGDVARKLLGSGEETDGGGIGIPEEEEVTGEEEEGAGVDDMEGLLLAAVVGMLLFVSILLLFVVGEEG